MSEPCFVQWKRKISSCGWSRVEPHETVFEGPEILQRSFDIVVCKGISLKEFAGHIGLSELGLAELLRANGLGSLMTDALVGTHESSTGKLEIKPAEHSGPMLRVIK